MGLHSLGSGRGVGDEVGPAHTHDGAGRLELEELWVDLGEHAADQAHRALHQAQHKAFALNTLVERQAVKVQLHAVRQGQQGAVAQVEHGRAVGAGEQAVTGQPAIAVLGMHVAAMSFDPNQTFDRFEGAHALGLGSAA